jgi:lambda repressor-like predicted transcriptional regulator
VRISKLKLERAMDAKGYDFAALARESGLGDETLRRLRCNEPEAVTNYNVIALAAALGVDSEAITNNAGRPRKTEGPR